MKQRVFGSYRTLGPDAAGRSRRLRPRASRLSSPTTPRATIRSGSTSIRRFEARFHEKPEQFASLAYDAMNALLDSICKAGLNRARIHDALANIEEYDGVTGHMVFDPNQKNVAPMYLGTVHNGAITYRVATMEKPPAVGQTPLARQEASAVPRRRLMRAWARMAWIMPARIAQMFRLARCVWFSLGRMRPRLRSRRRCRRSWRPPRRRAASGSWSPWRAIRIGARLQLNWFTR